MLGIRGVIFGPVSRYSVASDLGLLRVRFETILGEGLCSSSSVYCLQFSL